MAILQPLLDEHGVFQDGSQAKTLVKELDNKRWRGFPLPEERLFGAMFHHQSVLVCCCYRYSYEVFTHKYWHLMGYLQMQPVGFRY